MTTRSRRALYRVRNAAHRFVQAVEALGPKDLAELPRLTRYRLGFARNMAESTAGALTGLLHFGEGLPGDAPVGPTVPGTMPVSTLTLEAYAKARDPEDALMEAQDVGRELAEEEATL